MLLDLLTVIKTGLDVTKALREFKRKPDSREKNLEDDVSRALRTLYFTPTGILSLLKEVADGNQLSEKRIQKALNDFNDREWKVEAALGRIDFDALKRELALSLASISVLDQLRYGKINLRRAVQSEVNFYGQNATSPNKARAGKLIASIEQLNAEIEEVEGIINGRARGGPARRKPMKKAAKTATAKKKTSSPEK